MYDPYDFLEWKGNDSKEDIERIVKSDEGCSQNKKRSWQWRYKPLITQGIIVMSLLIELTAILSHMSETR